MSNIVELDLFYLSYDEPKKEEFYADLKNKCPWAKHVDGVKGFDNAHKACAEQSETDFFVTVDADNIVDPTFFDDQLILRDSLDSKTVFSFAGQNMLNGLIYGNGGIKIWPKQLALNMRTHENSTNTRAAIEFCWDMNYQQMHNCYSSVWPNGSPLQAFRSGYREGVKMSLAEGTRVDTDEFQKNIYRKNLQRLLVWCTIGADVENGDWAIYGARLGCADTNLNQMDITAVRDYDWFDTLWKNQIRKTFFNNDTYDATLLKQETEHLGRRLQRELGVEVSDFTPQQSKFFKQVFVNPLHLDPRVTEADVQRIVPKEYQ